MKMGIEVEPLKDAVRRHGYQIEITQSDRNYHYMEYKRADNFPLTSLGELIYMQNRLLFADHRLSRLEEKGPRQRRSFVLGRIRFPLPSIPVSAMVA